MSPELRPPPWVGGLRRGYKRQRPGTIELNDLTQRQRMVAEVRGLVDDGFDGVHVDIEPVDDDNDEFLALLRALRTAVGETTCCLSPRHGPPRSACRVRPTSRGAPTTTRAWRRPWTRS